MRRQCCVYPGPRCCCHQLLFFGSQTFCLELNFKKITLQLRVTGSPRATTVSEGCSRITGADVEQQPGREMDSEIACGGILGGSKDGT